ncbi:MAG: polyribonucleotide nucleotidyltransferase [Sedimentisphaerales bacterium]|nr:polyribonucleotide nucleotidyltransferase [Sedimentisphaerales bacterium]
MFQIHTVERQIAGRMLTLETGRIGRQADGAVLVRYGDTMVLVSAVTAPPMNEDIDYFPLSVEYRERYSAAGKFPQGFIKREGRPSTKEILTARMIDRPIRPLFPEGYFQEVQIIASVLSADRDNDPDVPAIIGASAALAISKIPFQGPIAACRVGLINGQFVINPTPSQLAESQMNLLVGGHSRAVNMIELGAKEVSEQTVSQAIQEAHKVIIEICQMIEELAAKVNPVKESPVELVDPGLVSLIEADFVQQLRAAKCIAEKRARNQAVDQILQQVMERFGPGEGVDQGQRYPALMVKRAFDKAAERIVRNLILEGKRLDGRTYDQIRPITCEVGILPRTHGSAMFTRGETQALVSVTLGTISDAQVIDGLLEEYLQNFTFHYNFPPFSVGEVKPIRGPSRREIGHGALAERALEPVRPLEDKFAYTIRVVSDITESNGSSSMASVCGGSLALMDAGVPVTAAVAGISIGMVTAQDGSYKLLTDIIGEEDHYGDMDFKVAGTRKGITAIQLDIKTEGIDHQVIAEALTRAKEARLQILDIMDQVISQPRPNISPHAPKLVTLEIDPECIGKVIGPAGKMIKTIQEQTNTTIEIEEDGTVFISCTDGDGHLQAKEIIENMTQPPQVGRLYRNAKVVAVKNFGAFLEITPGVEGLCHISELSDAYVKNIESVCKVGDTIPVKLIAIDEQGRLKLSRKAAMADLGMTDKTPDSQAQARQQGSRQDRHDGGRSDQARHTGGRPREGQHQRHGHRPGQQ